MRQNSQRSGLFMLGNEALNVVAPRGRIYENICFSKCKARRGVHQITFSMCSGTFWLEAQEKLVYHVNY